MSVGGLTATQWIIPAALGLITVLGLLSALIGEGGIWWTFSWVALAVPCACSVVFLIRGITGPSRQSPRDLEI